MTNLEKFIEVFGYEPSRDLCNTMDCKTVGCSECKYNGKGWGDEYKGEEATPVVHAKWVSRQGFDENEYWIEYTNCKCGTAYYDVTNYCPQCGAKMDKED